MACHLIYLAPIFFFFFDGLRPILSESDNSHPLPNFAFGWLGDKDTYVAGDIMVLQVTVLGNYERDMYDYAFSPNISVNGKMGNSSLISGLSSHFDGDPRTWTISLVPIMVGLFNVLITDVHFKVFDSSLHFYVNPGPIYPPACVISWMDDMNEFVAGTKATVLILPKDAFGNNASSSNQGPAPFNLTVSASYVNGSFGTEFGSALVGWNPFGSISIEFQAVLSGNFFLSVERNQSLNGSPLPFKVNPGLLDVKNCVAKWKSDTKYFQLFSVMETYIHQRDQYGNLVPGFYDFDVEVFEKDTNLSMPVSDLNSKEIVPGIVLFSIGLTEPGNFNLMIYDNEQKNFISNVPYEFTVYIGYCDGMNSFANGSGLNDSVAGKASTFSVVLRDSYQYPSPIKLEFLQVDIVHESGIHIQPLIFQIDTNWNSSSNMFEIVYTPEKSGLYAISVMCGNVPLNGGHPFTKKVLAGDVNMSLSGVMNFSSKVPKMIKNEIVVRLMDSFSNPILLQQPKLKLEISSINKSDFSYWKFSNIHDGMYTASYMVNQVGTYGICASLNGQHFLPCPFSVNAYSGEYFPKAYDDKVYVLEDESIAFNVLENDYLAGNASIIEFSKPTRGSLLQYGPQYRYTPYRGYVGNDSFSYVVSDVNGNIAIGAVNISVLSIPPQLISFPSQLKATEDEITPKFSGFQGFEIMYSDLTKKISIALTAHHGIIFLSPIPVQFWKKTLWDELYLMNNGDSQELTIIGRLEAVNYALQSIQYMGKENFFGEDVIHVSTSDGNGVNGVDIPIYVEPINDPPFINVPKLIILKKRNNSNEEGYLIFERGRDNFNFSVGDPDLLYFQGNKTEFLVIFSLEINSGLLSTNLPAELINSTELKLKGSYQWQSLQTFVTISRHFTVKARGIRFIGTVDNCNSLLQDGLYYHNEEEEHGGGAMLTMKINDMGNYGCNPSFCQEKENISQPVFAHADIHLITSRPMSPFAAHSIGSAIVIGSIMVFSLGLVLLFFTCKCTFLLINGRKKLRTSKL